MCLYLSAFPPPDSPIFKKRIGETAVYGIQYGIELDGFILEQDLEFHFIDIFNGHLVQVEAEKYLIDAETVIEAGQDDVPGAMHRSEPRGRNDLPG